MKFRARQNGMTVASTESRDIDFAEAEIMRYALQYQQDGDVTIERNNGNGWRLFARMQKSPTKERDND